VIVLGCTPYVRLELATVLGDRDFQAMLSPLKISLMFLRTRQQPDLVRRGPDKLVKQMRIGAARTGSSLFGSFQVGQLQAATDARSINNASEYSGPTKIHFDRASEHYGKSARGLRDLAANAGLNMDTVFS
jgi:hypothetical protein